MGVSTTETTERFFSTRFQSAGRESADRLFSKGTNMASRFSALPLSSGESFLLETDHAGKRWVIMVDGGQSKSETPEENELYQAIRKHCPDVTSAIDIAICTHRDHDHAGGFPAFVKTWLTEGKNIGEFWLPGGWAGAVEMALTNPDRLVSMLHEGAVVAASRILGPERTVESMVPNPFGDRVLRSIQSQLHDMPDDHRGKRHSNEKSTFRREQEDDGRTGSDRKTRAARSWGFTVDDWETVQSDLETSEIHSESLADRASAYNNLFGEQVTYEIYIDDDTDYGSVTRRTVPKPIQGSQLARSLFRSAIDTAEAIRDTAKAAAMFDIPVRWFDFAAFQDGSYPSGGIIGLLQPLNAIELSEAVSETDSLRLFFKLTLTEQNVASLVFQRPESDTEPGVIFLGDSRLAFGIDKPERNFDKHLAVPGRPIIYTAPHHGSRNNDRAYEVLSDWIPSVFATSIAVRNGGVWNQTLSRYREIENRRCAQCCQCNGRGWSQLVQISSNDAKWTWPSDRGGECGVPKRPSN